jgi:hypothetical protein
MPEPLKVQAEVYAVIILLFQKNDLYGRGSGISI